jgi:hypothetical protein
MTLLVIAGSLWLRFDIEDALLRDGPILVVRTRPRKRQDSIEPKLISKHALF